MHNIQLNKISYDGNLLRKNTDLFIKNNKLIYYLLKLNLSQTKPNK